MLGALVLQRPEWFTMKDPTAKGTSLNCGLASIYIDTGICYFLYADTHICYLHYTDTDVCYLILQVDLCQVRSSLSSSSSKKFQNNFIAVLAFGNLKLNEVAFRNEVSLQYLKY